MEIDEAHTDEENSLELRREYKRLEDLTKLRGLGIRLAVKSAEIIEERLMASGQDKAQLRDVNRSLEIVTKTAILADNMLQRNTSPEAEAIAPQKDVVLIILKSPIPDERRRLMLKDLAEEWGNTQLVYDALVAVSDSGRADELLELNA